MSVLMSDLLYTMLSKQLHAIDAAHCNLMRDALESGQVIFCPHYAFLPVADERDLLSLTQSDLTQKNISYYHIKNHVLGISSTSRHRSSLQGMMRRYALFARQLVDTLFPYYNHALVWGRTSYRPAEIANRSVSKRQDDTRLHVDAFPATPVNGSRILRVFCNINPHEQARVWHLGESFSQVLTHFKHQLPAYSGFRANLLKQLRLTKTLRTPYDHFMLNLHDSMKLDDMYQAHVSKQRVEFPAHSTWIVFSDQVSHAALTGQFLLEQTFYLPVDAMACSEHSPYHQLIAHGVLQPRTHQMGLAS